MFKKYQLKYFNLRILLIVAALCVMGYLLIQSATMDDIDRMGLPKRQLFGILVGFISMMVLAFFDYHLLFKFGPIIYIINIGLLLLTKIKGETNLGAQRWVVLPVIGNVQPSEFSKIAIVITLAAILELRKDKINSSITWLMIAAVIFPPLLLIADQPDLSTTILIFASSCLMIYVAKLSYKVIVSVFAVAVPTIVWFIYSLLQGNNLFLRDYQVKRVLSFIDPKKYQDQIYQQENSVMAIGSGGLWGKGLYNTSAESVKNGNYLSEAQTDFIFTICGEELGFVGCMTILGLFIFLIVEIIRIAKNSDSLGGRTICVGISSILAMQTFIHVAVNLWLMPNTGLPLPFVSYGLSSIISSFMLIGLILNVSMQQDRKLKKKGLFSDL